MGGYIDVWLRTLTPTIRWDIVAARATSPFTAVVLSCGDLYETEDFPTGPNSHISLTSYCPNLSHSRKYPARDRALHGQKRAIVEATFGTWADALMVCATVGDV